MKTTGKDSLWVEKYRPQTIEDIIAPKSTMNFLKKIVETGELTSILLSGSAGLGKTAAARSLVNDLGAEELYINCSLETSIEVIRQRVQQFAMTHSAVMFGDDTEGKIKKIVVLDECLEENEEIRVGTVDNWKGMKLKNFELGKEYPIVSMNLETGESENDIGSLISDREDDVYKITLEYGKTVLANSKHPFFINNGEIQEKCIDDGLCVGELILTINPHTLNIKTKIERIEFIGKKKVRNLSVQKNHSFITANGIPSHNCERISPQGQDALKVLLEEASSNCRFIFCTNNMHKIIDPLHSRCKMLSFNYGPDQSKDIMLQYFKRMKYILANEGHKIDKAQQSILAEFIQQFFPDFRKMINELQGYLMQNDEIQIDLLKVGDSSQTNDLIDLIKNKQFNKMSALCSEIDADAFFTTFYKEVKRHVKPEAIPDIVLILRDGMHTHALAIDREINLIAVCVELMQALNGRWK